MVKEGTFRRAHLLHLVKRQKQLSVGGTALVQLVQRSDGGFCLRFSRFAIVNPKGVRLRVALYSRDAHNKRRRVKDRLLDVFSDKVWLDAGPEGACCGPRLAHTLRQLRCSGAGHWGWTWHCCGARPHAHDCTISTYWCALCAARVRRTRAHGGTQRDSRHGADAVAACHH